jgi:acetyl esterase/lipase
MSGRLITALSAALICAVIAGNASAGANDPEVVDLWPGKAPGETTDVGEGKLLDKGDGLKRVTDIVKPTLLVYRPDKATDTGTTLIIAPGGAYKYLAMDHEGETVAKWCASIGVTGVVLKYRVPRRPDNPQACFQDGQRAVSLVRSKAGAWGINPDRIGMIGFSAGGGVTNFVLSNPEKRSYEAVDAIDKVSSRLNFAAQIYAAGGLAKGAKNELTADTINQKNFPPVFFAVAYNDNLADGTIQSFLALKKAGVSAELHVYASGGHGFGMRPSNSPHIADWSERLKSWMQHQKLLDTKK